MNTHWLIILAEIVALTGLIVLFAFYTITPARAQAGASPNGALLPPPAYAITLRLLAQGRDREAVSKLREVETSVIYRNTAYAPEAVYMIAHIYRDRLRDRVQAIAAYDSLVTTYGLTAFPHQWAARAERQALRQTMDAINKRHFLYRLLDSFVQLTGRRSYSFALSLLLISVIVRLTLAPLSARQFRSAREMLALQPKIERLKLKHKDDAKRLYEEMKNLQDAHGVNPHWGWIIPLLQAPVFFAIYQAVQLYQYHAGGRFLWIGGGLAAAHPQFLALDLGLPDIPLLILYAVSMSLAPLLFPASDPAQAKMQKAAAWVAPVIYSIGIVAQHTASAFVLYWLISNILSTALQLYFSRTGKTAKAAIP